MKSVKKSAHATASDLTKKQAAFVHADVAERVRLAADVARRIATGGLAGYLEKDFDNESDEALLMYWLDLLGGSQCDRFTDEDLRLTGSFEDLEQFAAMAFSLGVAVGLRQRLEAYEGAPRRSKSEAGGDR